MGCTQLLPRSAAACVRRYAAMRSPPSSFLASLGSNNPFTTLTDCLFDWLETTMTTWREEKLHSAWRAKFEVANLVFEEKSEFQDIVVFDNENYGRMLMIDSIVQLSTRDEFIYHE